MSTPDFSNLKAIYINCTLKKSPRLSNTEKLMEVSMGIMKREGVQVDYVRFVDHNIASGVLPDMKDEGWEKDEWPELYKKIADANILVVGSPIWLGEMSSETKKLIERIYAMSGEKNDKGQYVFYGKAGGCIITGNEDGVKHCSMGILYSLQHVGYTIPPQSDAGWIGEAGPGPSYAEEGSGGPESDFTNRNTTFMTYNLLNIASLYKSNNGINNYGNSVDLWEKGERWKFEPPKIN
ncbi:flavodoxin family protein [Mangrovivirga sp. M17]|uniref:Flavodoxin family protein n=1 Tax=Mangrovivirga halotolerans TaxID=2993936 RepID=A0ABT3RMF8_9BACT|nr:flavodoxin family protein [Mangrovivirga halotolerans]MCX2743003.1 flavodoxin family protein [Mangrovivirga halotolerans]